MNIKTADAVRMDWGKFLEVCNGPLMMIFMSKIPQSLLPYPKRIIEESLDIVAKYFTSIGNDEAVKTIESTKPFLELYVEDRKALTSAAEKFGKEDYLKVILPKLNERQKQLLTELELRLNKGE